MGADENKAHMNGNVSSYTSLMKLAECKSTKTVEENDMPNVYEISDAQERVCFDVRFIKLIFFFPLYATILI